MVVPNDDVGLAVKTHKKALFKTKERDKDEANMGFCVECCNYVGGWEWRIISEAISEDSKDSEGGEGM